MLLLWNQKNNMCIKSRIRFGIFFIENTQCILTTAWLECTSSECRYYFLLLSFSQPYHRHHSLCNTFNTYFVCGVYLVVCFAERAWIFFISVTVSRISPHDRASASDTALNKNSEPTNFAFLSLSFISLFGIQLYFCLLQFLFLFIIHFILSFLSCFPFSFLVFFSSLRLPKT